MKLNALTNLGDYVLDADRCDPYTNAELTIKLRLGFRQINPPSGAAKGTYFDYGKQDPRKRGKDEKQIVPWSASVWTAWIKNFVGASQRFWDRRFWLVNNFSELEFENAKVKYRPNIDCRFELFGEEAAGRDYHHIIDAVRLDPSESWFGSHSRLYDSRDMRIGRTDTDESGNPIMQVAGFHEIGHLLGFSHVDYGKPHCRVGSNGNAKACYGFLDEDKRTIMGQGIALRNEHSLPWRRAMYVLTGKGNMASGTDWAPMRIRIYPRTMDEVAAGKQITTRPMR